MPERMPLSALISTIAKQADRTIAQVGSAQVSAGEFVRQVQAWRQSFAAAEGKQFALHLDDSASFAAALFGAWHAGKTIFLPADTLPATVQSIDAHVDGFSGNFPNALQAAADSAANDVDWQSLDLDVPRLVLYTSGSSGQPVAIPKTLRQLDCEIATLESRFGDRLGDALVQATVSHQHIYGLLFRVLWPLSAGRVFASDRLGYSEQIVAALANGQMTLIASPAMLKRIPETLDWSQARESLKAVFSSGGPLPSEAAESVSRLWGHAVIEVFGSTETGGIATREDTHSPWQAMPGVEIRIEQESLQIRSRHLPNDEWFETQDRARPAGEGFELLGRADRLIKLEERRVSLDAIERSLQAGPWAAASRVLLLPPERTRIAAVVVLTQVGRALLESEGRKSFIERLRTALRGQVEAIAIPRRWRFVESLPANSEGKTTDAMLANLFRSIRPEPQWLERGSQQARLLLFAGNDLAVFDGHFPQSPILPGVALLDWAIHCGREAFAIDSSFVRMDATKFQRVVMPGTELTLSLTWNDDNKALAFRFESDHGAHASGRILFAAAEVAA